MVRGNIGKIDTTSSSFKDLIEGDYLYVDKTKMVENFLNEPSRIQLICKQRRIGKSLNMDTLNCFLTSRADNAHLFDGLYVQNSNVWDKLNSAPVLHFDFKILNKGAYKKQIWQMIRKYIATFNLSIETNSDLFDFIQDRDYASTDGLFYLTEALTKSTGRKCYILVDEYDKLLTCLPAGTVENFENPAYSEIREFLTYLFQAALKGNEDNVEKALLTGVTRISNESMFSSLNNIEVFDIFTDNVYTDDYGLTEEEICELHNLKPFDKEEVRNWYNGIMINGKPIYNMFSVMRFLKSGKLDNYWASSGSIRLINNLITPSRKETLIKLLSGEHLCLPIANRVSLEGLHLDNLDEYFYSLLVQNGYLAIDSNKKLSLPNIELYDVWNEFILNRVLISNKSEVLNVFANYSNPALFAEDLENVLNYRLSYHDLFKDNQEKSYHIFLLGLFCAYSDNYNYLPKSNKESGRGRYDICVERKEAFFLIEIKKSSTQKGLLKAVNEALKQIENEEYFETLPKTKPVVKIGVAFCKTKCKVKVWQGDLQ